MTGNNLKQREDTKIAILGWGSLIWDLLSLPISGTWQKGGPILPIEFSRISRDGRLTLVIDERDGAEVCTRYALSSRRDLDEAIVDLKEREGVSSRDRIGFIELSKGRLNESARQSHPIAFNRIRAWVQEKGFDAVIWTALGSNFSNKKGKPFTPEAALQYVSQLIGKSKARALEYINNAPLEVDTPVRRLVLKHIKMPTRVGD